eukprot:2453288-Pleurochrysis_carterae.AAC.1
MSLVDGLGMTSTPTLSRGCPVRRGRWMPVLGVQHVIPLLGGPGSPSCVMRCRVPIHLRVVAPPLFLQRCGVAGPPHIDAWVWSSHLRLRSAWSWLARFL